MESPSFILPDLNTPEIMLILEDSGSECSEPMKKTTRKRKNSNIFKSCAVCEAPTQYSHYGKCVGEQ